MRNSILFALFAVLVAAIYVFDPPSSHSVTQHLVTAMSFTITDAFVQQFSANCNDLAQQGNSRLRGKVYEENITGEAAYMEQLAPTVARKVTTRHADSPIANIQHLRRRVATYPYDQGELLDKLDKVRLLIDPVSKYTNTIAMALRRGQDDEVINAFFSVAYTGHSGATAITWPNGNSESAPTAPPGKVVAVNSWVYGTGSGNAGLTISKLTEAMVALDTAEGDEGEERYILVPALKKGDLLSTTEVTSHDYNTVRALVDGKINTFLGFNFVHSERVQKNSSGQWRIPAWRKSGMGLGIAKDISGTVAQRPDKRFAWYAYADEDIGASRLEEPKVVEIICTV